MVWLATPAFGVWLLGSNRMGPDALRTLCRVLHNHPSLTMLDVGMYKSSADMGELTNRVGDEGAAHVAELMGQNSHLRILNVSFNGLSDKGLSSLRDALKDNTHVMHLHYGEYGQVFDRQLRTEIQQLLDRNTRQVGMTNQQYIKQHLRFEKHTECIRNIDSIYRNKM